MTTILRFILFFLLIPVVTIVAQTAGAVQDGFHIVDTGFWTESAILDSVDGGICNYDSNGALLQQRRSINGKAADEDGLNCLWELEAKGTAQPLLSFSAEFVAANKIGSKVDDVIHVTPDGIAFPSGPKYKIPDNYVQNPNRSGSYGEVVNGKFKERLRIDPATPPGKKGPQNSHYHLDGGKEHYSPRPGDQDPGFGGGN